jgi:predicted transcriptional regulator
MNIKTQNWLTAALIVFLGLLQIRVLIKINSAVSSLSSVVTQEDIKNSNEEVSRRLDKIHSDVNRIEDRIERDLR